MGRRLQINFITDKLLNRPNYQECLEHLSQLEQHRVPNVIYDIHRMSLLSNLLTSKCEFVIEVYHYSLRLAPVTTYLLISDSTLFKIL